MKLMTVLLLGSVFCAYGAASSSSSSDSSPERSPGHSLSSSSSNRSHSRSPSPSHEEDQGYHARRTHVVEEAFKLIGPKRKIIVEFEVNRYLQRKGAKGWKKRADSASVLMEKAPVQGVASAIGLGTVATILAKAPSVLSKGIEYGVVGVGKYRDYMRGDLTKQEELLIAFLIAEQKTKGIKGSDPKYKARKSNRDQALNALEIANIEVSMTLLNRIIDSEFELQELVDKQQKNAVALNSEPTSKKLLREKKEIEAEISLLSVTPSDKAKMSQDLQQLQERLVEARARQEQQEEQEVGKPTDRMEILEYKVEKLRGHIRFLHDYLFNQYQLTTETHKKGAHYGRGKPHDALEHERLGRKGQGQRQMSPHASPHRSSSPISDHE